MPTHGFTVDVTWRGSKADIASLKVTCDRDLGSVKAGADLSSKFTRTPGRASAMPARENLATFAQTGATLAIHLSIHNLAQVVADLRPEYGGDCPVAVVWRASWPDERVVRATLDTVLAAVAGTMERTALILVGRVLGAADFAESSLYAADYDRRFRPRSGAGA